VTKPGQPTLGLSARTVVTSPARSGATHAANVTLGSSWS
jgi:hypothetical protein